MINYFGRYWKKTFESCKHKKAKATKQKILKSVALQLERSNEKIRELTTDLIITGKNVINCLQHKEIGLYLIEELIAHR